MGGGHQRWEGVGGFHGGGLALKNELGVHVKNEMPGGEELDLLLAQFSSCPCRCCGPLFPEVAFGFLDGVPK